MSRLLFFLYSWLVFVPLMAATTLICGLICLVLVPFLPADRVARYSAVPWAKLCLLYSGVRVDLYGRHHLHPRQMAGQLPQHGRREKDQRDEGGGDKDEALVLGAADGEDPVLQLEVGCKEQHDRTQFEPGLQPWVHFTLFGHFAPVVPQMFSRQVPRSPPRGQ